jgi:hypothetical protein
LERKFAGTMICTKILRDGVWEYGDVSGKSTKVAPVLESHCDRMLDNTLMVLMDDD